MSTRGVSRVAKRISFRGIEQTNVLPPGIKRKRQKVQRLSYECEDVSGTSSEEQARSEALCPSVSQPEPTAGLISVPDFASHSMKAGVGCYVTVPSPEAMSNRQRPSQDSAPGTTLFPQRNNLTFGSLAGGEVHAPDQSVKTCCSFQRAKDHFLDIPKGDAFDPVLLSLPKEVEISPQELERRTSLKFAQKADASGLDPFELL